MRRPGKGAVTMKKQLFLTSAMAATLSGCSSEPDWDGTVYARNDTAVCVDQNGYRVDDDYCDTRSTGRFYTHSHGWYYVRSGSPVPYWGESVNDKRYGFSGSRTPTPGAVYGRAPAETAVARSTAIARGGFGSSGRSFGGGKS